MCRIASLLGMVLIVQVAQSQTKLLSPADVMQIAAADIQRMPTGIQSYCRYISLASMPLEKRREAIGVLSFHINSLSREAEIVRPAVVAADFSVVRLNITDYAWDRKVWEKLGDNEPYFHVHVITETEGYDEYGHEDPKTKEFVVTRREKNGKKTKKSVNALAPWLTESELHKAGLKALVELTQSQCPVVDAAWFVNQTAIQVDRDGHGYYDFLGLGKKQADFDELVGFDLKLAERFKAEINGVVIKSTVSLNNRRIVRFGKIGGAKWVTLDAKNNVDRRNFARVLDDGFLFDATEQIGSLPCGLHAFWLANSKGERQDSAPDFIASDKQSAGTDARVHSGKSCIGCHVEGIRPIDDWVRKLINPPLQTPDYDKARRLRQLYLSNLAEKVQEDGDLYARAVRRANGLTLAENASAYSNFWDSYAESMFGFDRIQYYVGVPRDKLLKSLQDYTKAVGAVDPLLGGLLQVGGEVPLRVEQMEEVFPLIMSAVKGVIPVDIRGKP